MPTITYKQSDFSRGEIDPRLWSRDNFEGYAKGARDLTNSLVIPQGGTKRRFGTDFISALTGITDKSEVRIVLFELEDTSTFVLIYTDLLITVFQNDVQLTTVVSPYTKAQLPDVRFAQTENILVSVHKDVTPYQLTYTDVPTPVFTYKAVNFKNEPTSSFEFNYDKAKFAVGSTALGANVLLTVTSVDSFPDVIEQRDMDNNPPAFVVTDRYIHVGDTYSDGGFIIQNGDILEGTNVGAPFGNVYIPKADGATNGSVPHNGSLVLITALSKYYEFNSSSGLWEEHGLLTFQFDRKYVGGVFFGNGGTMRLTDFISVAQMKGTILKIFDNTNSFPGSEAVLSQPIFNETHGFPRAVAFFQNRLWMGGTKDLPSGVFSSKPGADSFFDFDDAGSDPQFGIGFFVATGSTNIVRDLLGAKDLAIFTTTGVSVTSSLSESGITPGNDDLDLVTTSGVSNLNGVFLDNQVVFVDIGGKIIHSMQFSVNEQSYQDKDVSILSQHLINEPQSMALFKNPHTDNGSYLIVVNKDGTLALFLTLQQEDVKAWTPANTKAGTGSHYFRHVASAHNDVYFITEREINSVEKWYLEKMSFTNLLDCTISGTNAPASMTISGLSALEGETVQVKSAGYLVPGTGLTPGVVTGGEITVAWAVEDYIAGLPYEAVLEALPIKAEGQSGTLYYQKKTYKLFYLDYYQALGLEVNGVPVKNLQADVTQFDTVPKPLDGYSVLHPMKGWDIYQGIRITQNVPFDFIIRAYGMKVDVSEN